MTDCAIKNTHKDIVHKTQQSASSATSTTNGWRTCFLDGELSHCELPGHQLLFFVQEAEPRRKQRLR
jgi:hypothetical protein